MHDQAFKFVAGCLERLPPRKSVLEFGGRNINGTVRVLFDGGLPYTSIDLYPGPGVDCVADAVSYHPETTPDTIICTEVLEHSPMWPVIVQHAKALLSEDGVLIITCATYPRAPHSTVDGHVLYPHEHEYYHNIDPMELGAVVEGAGFKEWDIEVEELVGDLRLLARM